MRPQHVNPQEAVQVHQVRGRRDFVGTLAHRCGIIFFGNVFMRTTRGLKCPGEACMQWQSLAEVCTIDERTPQYKAMMCMQDVRSMQSIGIHCCTFCLTDEAMDEPPQLLTRHAAAAGLVPSSFVTLQHGACLQTAAGVARNEPPLLGGA